MSLPNFDTQGSLLTSIQCVAPDLFAEDDRYLLFGRKIWPVLAGTRAKLAECYCQDNGRAGFEPVVLLGVLVLQFMERLPDRQAAQTLKYHLGWKLALNVPLDAPSFHPTTLVYFRARLLEHEQAQLAFEAVLAALREAGLISKRTRQRVDSTHVIGLVARLSLLESARETLRLALSEIAAAVAEEARPPRFGVWWERYVEHKVDFKSSEALLRSKHAQAGEDMQAILTWVASQPEALRQGKQVVLLGQVFAGQFEVIEEAADKDDEGGSGSAKLSVKKLRAQPAGAIQNPHEPEAQWSAKGTGEQLKDWVGYKVQVAESLGAEPTIKGEPERNFLTTLHTQSAIESDMAGMEAVMAAQAAAGLEKPAELYVDTAYVSAATLTAAQAEGRELVGLARESPTNQQPGFRASDFTISISERTARCPAGGVSPHSSRLVEAKSGAVSYRFEFGQQCHSCTLRSQCVGKGQQHRTLTVTEHHEALQARRLEQKTEAFQKRLHQRNAIEGTHSELVRAHGLRRARYRGLAKVRFQNWLIGAACNVKRWLRVLAWEAKQTARGGNGGNGAEAASAVPA